MGLNVDYVLGFNPGGQSGKSKATQDKILYLKRQVSSLRVYSPGGNPKSKLGKVWRALELEFKYFFSMLRRSDMPDVIFARSSLCFGTYLAGRLYGIPVIREIHADFLDEAKILFSRSRILLLLSRMFQAYLLFFYSRADGLIFNNPLLERFYRDQLGILTNSISVYNACNTEDFYPIDRAVALEKVGLPKDKRYLVFVGSISPWHGVEYALEMYQHLRKLRSDIDLLIVGGSNSSYANAVQSKYRSVEGVTFVGPVSKKDALYFINGALACLLTVHDNRISPGSPIKLYDYIACGKPIISQADLPGYSDVVEQHELGITCDFNDSAAAARKIDEFLEACDEAHYLYHNREKAEKELNWSTAMKAWLDFARLLTAKRS